MGDIGVGDLYLQNTAMPVRTPRKIPRNPGIGMEAAPVVEPTLVRKSTDSMPSRRVVVRARMKTWYPCFDSVVACTWWEWNTSQDSAHLMPLLYSSLGPVQNVPTGGIQ